MLKKIFKALLWVGKWYLKITVLLWAFIGIGEVAEQHGRLSSVWQKACNIKDRKAKRQYKKKIRRLVQNHVWDMAILKWKFGLGLLTKDSELVKEKEKEESGDE